MGSDDADGWTEDGEGPVREVELKPFHLSRTAVTNAQFAAFVEATGYVSDAEKFGWSYVFHLLLSKKQLRKLQSLGRVKNLQWWVAVKGAYWRRPEGPGSHVRDRLDHPVVHISWFDATAFCQWAGTRLPTEAEWEFAGRGGLQRQRYCWGNELTPDGRHMCNIWQGKFPHQNSAADGFIGTAPADSFPANGYGFHNMAGNVWEWCADWFSPSWHMPGNPLTRINPQGPTSGDRRAMRGGSYLCHDSYCNRYRVGARTSNTPDSSTGNLGFRVAKD